MVFMPFCYAEAAANLLTKPALDPFDKIPEFKLCAVKAEKVEQQSRRSSRSARDRAQFVLSATAACCASFPCAMTASSRAMFSSRRWLVRTRK
jgi:hypothetical protein